jgi:hypothetical protein
MCCFFPSRFDGQTLLQVGHDVVPQESRTERRKDGHTLVAALQRCATLHGGAAELWEGRCGVWEMMTGGVVVTKECVATAQSHASPEMAVVLADELCLKAQGNAIGAAARQSEAPIHCCPGAALVGRPQR